MITVSQIRDRLFEYLTHEITLNQFEDWLVLQSWNMHLDSDLSAQQLVGAIELRLAEYSNDHLSDVALIGELQGLISPSLYVSLDGDPIEPTVTGSGTASEAFWEVFELSQAA